MNQIIQGFNEVWCKLVNKTCTKLKVGIIHEDSGTLQHTYIYIMQNVLLLELNYFVICSPTLLLGYVITDKQKKTMKLGCFFI